MSKCLPLCFQSAWVKDIAVYETLFWDSVCNNVDVYAHTHRDTLDNQLDGQLSRQIDGWIDRHQLKIKKNGQKMLSGKQNWLYKNGNQLRPELKFQKNHHVGDFFPSNTGI